MIADVARTAVAHAIDGLAQAAADELPEDIMAERTDEGLRLTGPRLLARWASDVRLRGLAALATRSMR